MPNEVLELGSAWERLKPHLPGSFRGVVVACSGGVDSTVLFDLLAELANQKNIFQLALTHVAYGLRGDESEGDFSFVENLAKSHKIPFFSRIVNTDERDRRQGEGTQAWARRIRMEHFRDLYREGWVVALGHHLDDQAETVLFRLARGASPGKLLGMREWAPPLWRPLLSSSRAAIMAYAGKRGISYREDSSNAKLDYARNVIRHQVLKSLSQLFPGAPSRIVACATEAAILAADYPRTKAHTDASNLVMTKPEASLNPTFSHVAPAPAGQGLRVISPAEYRSWSIQEARHGIGQLINGQLESPRQLSRSWLDKTWNALRQGTRGLGPLSEVPGGGLLFLCEDGALSFTETSPNQGVKAERAAQHARALIGPPEDMLLEPGSQIVLNRVKASLKTVIAYRELPGGPALSPIRYRVYGGAAAHTFECEGQIKNWTIKEVMAALKIPLSQRVRFRFVEANGSTYGLTDGKYILRPGLKNMWIRDDQRMMDSLRSMTDANDAFAVGEADA